MRVSPEMVKSAAEESDLTIAKGVWYSMTEHTICPLGALLYKFLQQCYMHTGGLIPPYAFDDAACERFGPFYRKGFVHAVDGHAMECPASLPTFSDAEYEEYQLGYEEGLFNKKELGL